MDEAHEPLLPLLKADDAEVRAQAAKVLGDLRRPEAFSGLMALFNDSLESFTWTSASIMSMMSANSLSYLLFTIR